MKSCNKIDIRATTTIFTDKASRYTISCSNMVNKIKTKKDQREKKMVVCDNDGRTELKCILDATQINCEQSKHQESIKTYRPKRDISVIIVKLCVMLQRLPIVQLRPSATNPCHTHTLLCSPIWFRSYCSFINSITHTTHKKESVSSNTEKSRNGVQSTAHRNNK